MQIKKDVQETVKLKLPPEDIEQQINEKLKEEYSGSLHDVVAKVFKSIIKISIIIPGGFERYQKFEALNEEINHFIVVLLSTAVLSVLWRLLKVSCSSWPRVWSSFPSQLSTWKSMKSEVLSLTE